MERQAGAFGAQGVRCGREGVLATEAEAFPGVVFLKAGTLNDPSWLDPKLHIWTQSMQPWVTIGADATSAEQNPG